MANAAAKKAAKAANVVSNKTGAVIGGSVLFFLLYRCLWNYSSLSWLHILGFLFQVVCLIVAFYGMIEAAKNNASTEMYFDLYCVTVASQVLSAISDWGWYLLIAIPLYGGYLAYGLWKSNPLSSLMGGGPVAPADDDDDAPASRKERRKVKYARK